MNTIFSDFLLVMLLDIDELDDKCSGVIVHESPNPTPKNSHYTSLDYGSLLEMKKILLGQHKRDFPEGWKIQNLQLQSKSSIYYGISQQKGGPCGILACVQAYLLREIFFGDENLQASPGKRQERFEMRKNNCLASALSHILWKCGNRMKAVVAIPSNKSTGEESWLGPRDGFSEKIGLFYFVKFNELQEFISSNISWYILNDYALISFLYSALLSRGIETVKQDMDDPNIPIIGVHGYCSQEIINLLLTGEACSNVFDGTLTLKGDKSELVLKGIQRPSEFGFLTIMEHYESCKVGNNFKFPQLPIWVVCSESHYTVLFSKQLMNSSNDELKHNCSPIDLFYYDGLVGQEDEICLTLTPNAIHVKSSDALVPLLEHCIRTKWKNAAVNWNGNDPIL